MKKSLPNFLKFRHAEDLIRIGRDNDGGYLISENDLRKSEILISGGINDDWSFESDFHSINQVSIKAYDGSISAQKFLKKLVHKIITFPFKLSTKGLVEKYIIFAGYIKFFRNNKMHIKKHISKVNQKNSHSMESIFEKINSKKIFLKLDIEGSEYELLDEIVRHKHRLTGLVIEFHNCSNNAGKIENFVKNIDLPIAHIHANNSIQSNNDIIPELLEITFSKNAKYIDSVSLPHPLDMPCIKNKEEIELTM